MGAVTVASATAFSSVAICASTGLHPRRPFARRLRALAGGRQPVARHVAPRPRVVTRLSRTGIGAQQRLVALEVGFGILELRLRRADLGIGGRRLRSRLPDVFGARAGEQQAQLRIGLRAFGACPGDGELGVARVELRHRLPGGHTIALTHV
jgi:hypothetical protein